MSNFCVRKVENITKNFTFCQKALQICVKAKRRKNCKYKEKKEACNHNGYRLLRVVRERRLELPRRLTHAPQTCLSTCSSTLANCFFSKARVIITEKMRMSRINFKFSCLSDIHNCIGYAQQQRGKHKLAAGRG